ncbi:MAG: DUF983 domain-containing protein [Opitutales bacterium]|nr:DUF983 domain-containing protein [Opitutales bacterium]
MSEHLPRETILRRSLRHRCPRCDRPSVFKSAFRLHERCPHCGLPLEMEDGWSYGAVPLNYTFACVVWVLPVALLTLFGLLSVKTAVIVALLGVLVVPVLTFRLTKALWVGIYYAAVPGELRVRKEGEKGDVH